MEGCSKYCSFCVVPYTRGEEVSRPFEDVLTEIAELAQQGVLEVTLLGQNVNAYLGALGDAGETADFAMLLDHVCDMPGIERVRYTSPHPKDLRPETIEAMAGGTTSETAVGGMVSKISAARLATRAGCGVFIASGAEPRILARLLSGQGPGTFFVPSGLPLEARKRWLAHFQRPGGTLRVNARAIPALRERGSSLLAVGVTGAEGEFAAGDIVNIAGPDGLVFARGKAGFSREEIGGLAGRQGAELARLYPGRRRLEVVHRNDLVVL